MSDPLTAAGLARLRSAAERHVGDDRVPGLVALVARGDEVHVEALGTLAIGGAPVCQAVADSGAFGWDGGFGTSWLADPGPGLTVIVLTQRMFETSEPPQVHRDIQAAAYAALG